ncbi:MAG TPA: PepSY domain-containing protein [Rhodanobacter sp.]
MSLTHRFLKTTRTIHLYLGVFTAPALLFFAITGGLQTFGFHESTRGSDYQPPAWLASAAQLHKKQTTVMLLRRARPAEAVASGMDSHAAASTTPANAPSELRTTPAPNGPAGNAGARPKKNLLPMKLFFALVALSLAVSTLSGLYMACRYSRKPKLVGALLLAGMLLPVWLALT